MGLPKDRHGVEIDFTKGTKLISHGDIQKVGVIVWSDKRDKYIHLNDIEIDTDGFLIFIPEPPVTKGEK